MTLTTGRPAVEQPAVAVARLRTTFATGRTRDRSWREAQLDGLIRLLDEAEEELGAALVEDLGRTRFESALFDIVPTRAEAVHARKRLRSWMRRRRVRAPMTIQPGRAWFDYEPLGIALVIGAWNYPVHLTLAPLVAALAAGNCAILKPSELAPASSAALAALLPRYLDPDAVAVVEGAAESTQALIGEGLDHIFFTGSPSVGAAVMAAAALQLTPVTLELGGKCPAIVAPSAKLDLAARRIAFGKLVNSGQTCVAPDYVLVEESVREEFVGLLAATLAEFSEGQRKPIINSRHAARIAALVAGARGDTVLGGDVDVEGASAEPTVIVDPEPGSAILTEEIFGPVLPVVGVDSVVAAIEHVRRGGKPLAAYLFTEDRRDEQAVLARISTGGTVVNHVMVHLAVSDLPFGGVGTSGTGRYHGRWGFETFSNTKAVVRQRTWVDPRIAYPPYSPRVERLLRRMM